MRPVQPAVSVVRKKQPPGYRFSSACYEQIQLILVTRGALYCKGHKEDSSSELGPGMFALLRLGGAFTLTCRGMGYTGMGVIRTGEAPAALKGEPVTGLADGRVRLLSELVARHMDAPLPESPGALRALGEAMIWEVLALARERQAPEDRDWAAAVKTLLETSVGSGRPVREALASLPVSYRQLGRRFGARYGTSPKAYLERRRLDEARRLLISTSMSVTSIAVELGYSSSQHFAARFRRATGRTPSDCRREAGGTSARTQGDAKVRGGRRPG
jgi:AraC-like DNA-binding protein